jgi:hypothetical protein
MRTIPETDIEQRGLRAVDKQIREGPVHVLRDEQPTYIVMTEAHYAELVDAWHEAVLRGVQEAEAEIAAGLGKRYDDIEELLRDLNLPMPTPVTHSE